MQGMKRQYEKLLKEYLRSFPCVAVIGPRQCGKTTLLKTLGPKWKIYDLEKQSDFQVVADDPDLFLRLNPEETAIDEAQTLPALFPALRVAADSDRNKRGRFVITGSSSPVLLKSISETLAGRVGVIEMAPFSFLETRGRSKSRFLELLAGRAGARDIVRELRPHSGPREISDYWFRGGYPEPWIRRSSRFRALWMDQYARSYLYRDVAALFPGLDQQRFRAFSHLLAGLSGSIINYADVARTLGVSQPTARDYFEIAHGTFLWRRVPSYEKNALKRVVRHSKGYLRDSGLLHYLLRIPDARALLSHPRVGASWEGVVIEEIVRGLSAMGTGADYYYYRTGAGAEVDLVLEGEFGVIPIEIKRQSSAPDRLRSIRDFMDERRLPLGVVINNAESPLLYDERICGVPFGCL